MELTMTPEQALIEYLEEKVKLYEFRLNFIEMLAKASKKSGQVGFNNDHLIRFLNMSNGDLVDFANTLMDLKMVEIKK